MDGIKMDIFSARFSQDIKNTSAERTDKPCLDMEEGVYRVVGGISVTKLQYRKTNQSNITPIIGYKVQKGYVNESGDWVPVETLCITKEEGLELALAYNYRNAYVSTSVKKKRGANEVGHYLKPYPAKEESFTRDEAIVQAYEVDEFGSKVRPYQLTLREDECSSDFWALLEEDFNRKTRGHRENVGRKQAIKERKVEQIKQDLKLGRHNIVNPYRDKAKRASKKLSAGG